MQGPNDEATRQQCRDEWPQRIDEWERQNPDFCSAEDRHDAGSPEYAPDDEARCNTEPS